MCLLKCCLSFRPRSDLGVINRRLAVNKREAKMLREDIRELELEIDDASRGLRKARSLVEYAKKQLSELQDRHWAILSLYNPAKAGEEVEEALREFEANEAAARLQERDNDSTESSKAKDRSPKGGE